MRVVRVAGRRMIVAWVAICGACQLAAPEERRLPRSPAGRAAIPDVVAADPQVAEEVPAATVDPVPAVVLPAAEPPVAEAAPADDGSHCAEPPERIAAREEMQRMADGHARMAERVRVLRAELERASRELLEASAFERLPGLAREFAGRFAEVPDWGAASADLLTGLLEAAALWTAVCRALAAGPAECDRLDVVPGQDGGHCRLLVQLLKLARERPRRLSLPAALAIRLGWWGDWPRAEVLWQVARGGLPAEACERLAVAAAPGHWALPTCRALAAGDVAHCEVLAGSVRRRACVALVHGLPGARDGGAADPLGALLRERLELSSDASGCATWVPRVVTVVLDEAGVFEPAPLALPEIERRRGTAPAP